MRVLFDDRPSIACPTGIGRYASTTARLLRDLPGHEVLTLSTCGLDLASVEEEELELPSFIEDEGIDVFHSSLWYLPAVLPCRAVVSVHDAIPHTHPTLASEAFAPLWRRARAEAQRADAVVCPSDYAREQAISALALDPERVRTIPEAPDPVFSPRPRDEVARTLAAHDVQGPYLLVVGSVERRKNPDGVLDALAALPPERRPLLLFAGPAAGFDLPTEADRRGLGERVRSLGRVPDDALAALYTGALAVLVCSRAEGFGLPVVEAFACGAPVIASNVTSLPEVVDDAGILVDPGDPNEIAAAISMLQDVPSLRAELVGRGRARLDRCYSPEVVRAAFAGLYASLGQEVIA